MKATDKLIKLAEKFEMKISRATQDAQAGEVETALKSAGQWLSPDQVAPLLNVAKVPEDAALDIRIIVNQSLAVKFQVKSTPPNSILLDETDANPKVAAQNKAKNDMIRAKYQAPGNTLGNILNQKFAGSMASALKGAKITISDTVEAKMVTFA